MPQRRTTYLVLALDISATAKEGLDQLSFARCRSNDQCRATVLKSGIRIGPRCDEPFSCSELTCPDCAYQRSCVARSASLGRDSTGQQCFENHQIASGGRQTQCCTA